MMQGTMSLKFIGNDFNKLSDVSCESKGSIALQNSCYHPDNYVIESATICTVSVSVIKSRWAQIFEKSRSQLRLIIIRRVIWSTLQPEDPQISSATVQDLGTTVTWHMEFVYSCLSK